MKYKQYSNTWLWIGFGALAFFLLGGAQLLAATISAFFSALPLLVLGYVFYFIYNAAKQNTTMRSRLSQTGSEHNRFVELLVYILVQMGKSDGQLIAAETRVIYGFFQSQMHYIEIDLKWIADLIERGTRESMDLAVLCQEFKRHFPYEASLLLLELIGQIIAADGRLHEAEKRAAESILNFLDIREQDAYRFRQLYLNRQNNTGTRAAEEDHYAVLGLRRGATQEEIKKAYREACKQHHPDKVHHLGPEFMKVAEAKMQKINAAYKALTDNA